MLLNLVGVDISFDTIGAVFFSLLHLNYNFVSTLIMYQQIM